MGAFLIYLSGQTLVCLLPLLQHKYIGSGGTAIGNTPMLIYHNLYYSCVGVRCKNCVL